MSRMVYLCGSIEGRDDGGTKWRERITPDLEKMGFIVFDPTTQETKLTGLTSEEHRVKLMSLKDAGKWDEFLTYMSKIRDQDLLAVDNSLFIVALVPDMDGVRIGGTVHEIAKAWEKKIPVLWKCDGSPAKVNSWIMSLLLECGTRFDTWKDMLDHVKKEIAPKLKTAEKE